METIFSTTKFTEYGTSSKGLYFMKIEQRTEKDGWTITGFIDRVYDKEKKKYIYQAKDSVGNRIYADFNDLFILKNKFKENRKNLVDNAKLAQLSRIPKQQNKAQDKAITNQKGAERLNAIKNVREQKFGKEKTKEVAKQNPNVKTSENQKEKEQDLKNTEKYKDTEQGKEEKTLEQEITESNSSEEQIQEEPEQEQDLASERMEELEDIREQGDDREQDLEIDI